MSLIMKYQTELISTVIALITLLLLVQITKRLVKRFVRKKAIDPNRKKIILNLNYLLIYVLVGIAIAIIWGVNFKAFGLFIASVLTVLGIGFFAQWSILSNITAGLILYINS